MIKINEAKHINSTVEDSVNKVLNRQRSSPNQAVNKTENSHDALMSGNKSMIKTERLSEIGPAQTSNTDVYNMKPRQGATEKKDNVKVKDESIFKADSIDVSHHHLSQSNMDEKVIPNTATDYVNIDKTAFFGAQDKGVLNLAK